MTRLMDSIKAHAKSQCPKEACGLIVVHRGKRRYVACRNVADDPTEHFVLPAEDYASAEELGEVVMVVHSHPGISSDPSDADRVMCEASKLPWMIVSVDENGDYHDHKVIEPVGYAAPLVGREFAHGVLDCYTLVRDYYARELGVILPDFKRRANWWDKGQNLYMDNFEAAGFAPIQPDDVIQRGDILLMQLRSPVPNHAAVYIGDGNIMHHVQGRLSSRDLYSGYWQEVTRLIIRRKQNAA